MARKYDVYGDIYGYSDGCAGETLTFARKMAQNLSTAKERDYECDVWWNGTPVITYKHGVCVYDWVKESRPTYKIFEYTGDRRGKLLATYKTKRAAIAAQHRMFREQGMPTIFVEYKPAK